MSSQAARALPVDRDEPPQAKEVVMEGTAAPAARHRSVPVEVGRVVVGGAAPIVLNAANEVAVASFLAGAIRFAEIARIVEEVLEQSRFSAPHSIVDVLDIDRATRQHADSAMKANCH